MMLATTGPQSSDLCTDQQSVLPLALNRPYQPHAVCHLAGPAFAPVAAAAPILGGGPFAAARAADPFFSFSGRGGAGGQMTPVAQQQQQGVALDVSAAGGALPPPAARVRQCLRWRGHIVLHQEPLLTV